MYEPYLLVQQVMFPKAKYVVDPFHYTKCVMEALDKIRIRVENSYSINSKEYKLLKNKKNVSLLRKYGNDINWWVEVKRYKNNHLVNMLPGDILDEIKDISDELKRGYQLKEAFLDIINNVTYDTAGYQLLSWIELCNKSAIPEFIEAGATINHWLEYIINSFIDKRYSNGFTERRNNKIKVIKRVAFGYRNFDYLRKRMQYIFNNKMSGSKSKKKKNSKLDSFHFSKNNTFVPF